MADPSYAGLTLLVASLASCVCAETGEEIANRLCADCHGEYGRSETRDIPSIGGFSEYAIIDLLDTYRHGFRKARTVTLDDGSENDMQQVVDALSADEIEAVAFYYSEQEWRPHPQPFDAELARRGAAIHSRKCGKCHPKGGSVPDADHALLAGQWRDYLARELRNFTSGERRMADKMKKKFDTLSEADKDALLELYVSAGKY
ncbi:MAG: c-type cytochrome [Gammaproteobacteria bacterium]|nr:c-type cytochrome [Gammaproteobacteria bacterium]